MSENFVTVKECEQKRNAIRKEKHDALNKTTGIIFDLDKKLDNLENRTSENEKKNLKNHIILKNTGDNIQKEVNGINEEIKSFKKILWGGGVYIILSLLGLLGMLLKYIYQLISNHG